MLKHWSMTALTNFNQGVKNGHDDTRNEIEIKEIIG